MTDYDPESFKPDSGHLWELLERYLQPMVDEIMLDGVSMRGLLDQYVASDFQVDKLPVLTLG